MEFLHLPQKQLVPATVGDKKLIRWSLGLTQSGIFSSPALPALGE